jgi:serine/threonine protein kinase
MFKSGDKIEEFTVESTIATGTVGTLYKVRSESGETFALKVLKKELSGGDWRVRFEREFNILKKCDHP